MENAFAILLQTGATELWPEESHPWLHVIARFGPYALGAVLMFLVVRARPPETVPRPVRAR